MLINFNFRNSASLKKLTSVSDHTGITVYHFVNILNFFSLQVY